MTDKLILDACCGGRMFWYDRENPFTVYADIRDFDGRLCDERVFVVKPDIYADFRKMPFEDGTFNLVVFDPPHYKKIGETSWLAVKYGRLPEDWSTYLADGFRECFRVLKPFGVLIFKWSSGEIPFSDVIKLAPELPLFGDRGVNDKTRWTIFCKGARLKMEQELF